MDEILNDDRFKHIAKDQRFKNMPKNERKFKVDQRFKKMFSDKKFKLKYSVDKRGRPVNLTTNENMKKYYEISSSEAEGDNEQEEQDKAAEKETKDKYKLKIAPKLETKDDDDEEDESEIESDESESESESETESEDDDDESSVDQELEEIPWNDLDKDTKRDEKISPRLALCNMDWDRIKAQDIYMILNSFKPPQGVIKSVNIYLSEYGKERMEYENKHGPKELTESIESKITKVGSLNNDENDDGMLDGFVSDEEDANVKDEDDEGNKFDRRKLRIYQFNRLRYYYAIIECDSSETANKIYTECDGMEYESSATRIDLRFVPDDTTFDDEPHQTCTDAPDPVSFKPNLFFTTALTQTKVECTWDETPRDRLAITMKNYTEDDIKNTDFNRILATSSDEDDADNENNIDEIGSKGNIKLGKKTKKKKICSNVGEGADEDEDGLNQYKRILFSADTKQKKTRDADLEFSWEGGMEEEGFNSLLFKEENSKSNKKYDEKDKKHKLRRDLTEEEKKEAAQLSLLTMDAEEDTRAHFNLDELLLDKNKNKKKSRGEYDEEKLQRDDFEMNLKDPRFEAIYTDHKFNIDPSDQSFKKTKAMEVILEEKIKRIQKDQPNKDDRNGGSGDDAAREHAHISLMVKSIKSKAEILKRKKVEIDNIKKKIRLNKN